MGSEYEEVLKLIDKLLSAWIIPLDSREANITATAGDVTLADRTVAVGELLASMNGSNGEIAKVELIALITYIDTSGAVNYLECSTGTFNQWQISDDNSNWDDCPFAMGGALSGQHVAGDLEVQANGGSSMTFIADISDLANSTYKDDVDARYVLKLENAEALTNNLRMRVATFLRISYVVP